MNICRVVFLFSLVFLYAAASASAEEGNTFSSFTLYWENDIFIGTDRDYTNGLKLSMSTPYRTDRSGRHLPGWTYPVINELPFVSDPETFRSVSLSLGQNIYTPEDTGRSDLIDDDRPYAGITYVSAGFHNKTDGHKNSWEFSVGILGPHSYAEEIQDLAHDIIDSKRARGWDNQLKDELILDAVYESQWRILRVPVGEGYHYDFIPHLGGRLGNFAIYANAGAEARWGWNLPRNFGTCPIRAGCATDSSAGFIENGSSDYEPFGWHLFMAADGRAVLWDITLDGNTYRDSHSVDKEPFVADLMAGIGFEYGDFRGSYSYIYRTKQFESQGRDLIFGAISVTYSF